MTKSSLIDDEAVTVSAPPIVPPSERRPKSVPVQLTRRPDTVSTKNLNVVKDSKWQNISTFFFDLTKHILSEPLSRWGYIFHGCEINV